MKNLGNICRDLDFFPIGDNREPLKVLNRLRFTFIYLFIYLFIIYFLMFIFERETESTCEQGRGRERRGGVTEDPKQALC